MDQNTEPIAAGQDAAPTTDQAPVADANLTPDTGIAPAAPDAGLTSNPSTTPDIVSFGAPVEPTITPVETPAEPTIAVSPDAAPAINEVFVPTPEDGQPADAPIEEISDPEVPVEPAVIAPVETPAETPAEAEPSPIPPEVAPVEPPVVSAGVPEEPVAAEPTVLATDPTTIIPVAAEEQKPSFISRLLNLVGI
jgi:hypothetical protein